MQNLVNAGQRKGGLRREEIFRYFLCFILFLYSCSRLQVTPEDRSRSFMAQNVFPRKIFPFVGLGNK